MNADVIYTLYHLEDDKPNYFYVGVSDCFDRRFGEHRTNFRDTYVEKKRAGEKKTGKYSEAAQLPEYVYARSVCKTAEDMLGEVVVACEEDSSFTEAYVAVELIRAGYTLYQSEGKLLKYQRMAADKTYENKSPADAGAWKEPAVMDATDITIQQLQQEQEFEKELLGELKSPGWKKGKKHIGRLFFERWKWTNDIGVLYYCCKVTYNYGASITVSGDTYGEAYWKLVRLIIKENRK